MDATDTFRLRVIRIIAVIVSILYLITACLLLAITISNKKLTPFIVVQCLYLVAQGMFGLFASLSRSIKTILFFIFLCVANALLVGVVLTVDSDVPDSKLSPNQTEYRTTLGPPTSPRPNEMTKATTTTQRTTLRGTTPNPTSTTMATTTTKLKTTTRVPDIIPISMTSQRASSWLWGHDRVDDKLEVDKTEDDKKDEWVRRVVERILWGTVGMDILGTIFGCTLLLLLNDQIPQSTVASQARISGKEESLPDRYPSIPQAASRPASKSTSQSHKSNQANQNVKSRRSIKSQRLPPSRSSSKSSQKQR